MHRLPQLALVLLPQAAELVLGAEFGRWWAGELHLEGGGGEVNLGQRQGISGGHMQGLGGVCVPGTAPPPGHTCRMTLSGWLKLGALDLALELSWVAGHKPRSFRPQVRTLEEEDG